MGQQVIKCPDGKFAIFSSVIDRWIVTDATAEDIVEYFVEEAATAAREKAERTMRMVVAGQQREIYFQFTKTFDEANAMSAAHGGALHIFQPLHRIWHLLHKNPQPSAALTTTSRQSS